MKTAMHKEERRIWGVAAVVSLVVVGGLVLLFRFPAVTEVKPLPTTRTSEASKMPMVGLTRLDGASADTLLKEEATFFDPTPLFLPTEWNVAQNALPDNLIRDSGQIFQDYAPKLTFGEADLTRAFPPAVRVPAKAADALAVLEPEQPFAGMGRIQRAIAELAGRGAVVEITAAGNGQRMPTLTVDTAGIPAGNWRPLEFLVAVDAAGLVGPPVLTAQSGVEEVDSYFQNLLAKTLRVGERLAPGAYRICVGP
jgi:hypothetical protein